MRKPSNWWMLFVTCGVLCAAVIGGPVYADMTLEEAREMVRAGHEAHKRGEYREAVRLARKVLEERGNMHVRWAGPGAKHPAPEADIYDDMAFIDAQDLAAQATGQEVRIRVRGTTAEKVLLHALFRMRDWKASAQLAEEILKRAPHADVARELLLIARAKMVEAKKPPPALVTYTEGRSFHIVGEGVPREGRLWVPLRAVEQVPGSRVSWDQATGSATLLVGSHTFRVWPGRQEVLVDGALRPLTAAPYLDRGCLRVPVRLLAKALNREVKWEADSRLLHIVPKIAWVR